MDLLLGSAAQGPTPGLQGVAGVSPSAVSGTAIVAGTLVAVHDARVGGSDQRRGLGGDRRSFA